MKFNFRKIFTICLLTILCELAQAQRYVTIADDYSGACIPHAHIYDSISGSGIVSNAEGTANFSKFYDEGVTHLVLNHIGYTKKVILLDSIKAPDTLYLIPKVYELQAVQVQNDPSSDLLKLALDKHIKSIPEYAKFETYYREYVSDDSVFVKYADGILDYHSRKKGNKYDTKVSIDQSRVFDLADEEEIDFSLLSLINIRTIIGYNHVTSLNKFLNEDNFQKYNYDVVSDSLPDHFVIHVSGDTSVHESLYSGTIVIRKSDHFISEISYNLDPDFLKYNTGVKVLDIRVKTLGHRGFFQYKESPHGTFLKYGKVELTLDINTKKAHQVSGFTSEVLAFSISEKQDKFKSYGKKNLFKSDGEYSEAFWLRGSALPATREEQELINELSTLTSKK